MAVYISIDIELSIWLDDGWSEAIRVGCAARRRRPGLRCAPPGLQVTEESIGNKFKNEGHSASTLLSIDRLNSAITSIDGERGLLFGVASDSPAAAAVKLHWPSAATMSGYLVKEFIPPRLR